MPNSHTSSCVLLPFRFRSIYCSMNIPPVSSHSRRLGKLNFLACAVGRFHRGPNLLIHFYSVEDVLKGNQKVRNLVSMVGSRYITPWALEGSDSPKCFRLPRPAGTFPLSLLLSKYRLLRFSSFPSVLGMGPCNWLWSNKSVSVRQEYGRNMSKVISRWQEMGVVTTTLLTQIEEIWHPLWNFPGQLVGTKIQDGCMKQEENGIGENKEDRTLEGRASLNVLT